MEMNVPSSRIGVHSFYPIVQWDKNVNIKIFSDFFFGLEENI